MPSLKERLKEILVTNGLLTQEQLDQALRVQQSQGGNLQKVLTELGYVSEQDLVSAISQGLNIPPIRLARCKVDPEVTKLVTREVARHYQLLPISKMGTALTVAMTDPLNVFAIDAITRLTGFTISPIIATSQEIQQAIERYYGDAASEKLDGLVKDIQRTKEEAQAQQAAESDVVALPKLTDEAPVVKLAEILMSNAVHMHASDVLVEPMENRLRIRYRIDGVLREVEAPPKHLHPALVSRLKVMSSMNIAEHRMPQDGRFLMSFNNRPVDFRISVIPSTFGEKVAVRILDKQHVRLDLDKLGFAPQDAERLRQCAKRPHGLLLVCGPTGSGKTTALYALLQHIQSVERNLVTVEDPVEFQLHGVNQVTVNADIGLTFATALRSILRQDPNIIMVGEIRDRETADMAIKSALTGHLVLSTLHTTTAAGAVVRLVNMGIEPFLLASTLTASVGQRLVRKVCQRCKQPKTLPMEMARQLGLLGPDGQPIQVWKGAGCPACFQTGYSGREVVAEVMAVTPEMREAISHAGAREHAVAALARANGMQTMREQGLAKVRAGITTVEEIIRTTMGDRLEEAAGVERPPEAP